MSQNNNVQRQLPVIKMHKTVYGDDFATAVPGWIAVRYSAGQEITFMLRQVGFNSYSGLPTYICRIVWANGEQSNVFTHKRDAALQWFRDNYEDAEFELEGNTK